MKRLVIIAAAALAAIAMMATLSAASASAGTVLCKTQNTTCPQGDILPAGNVYQTASPPGSYFTISSGKETTLKCSFNIMGMKTTLRNGNPLSGKFEGTLSPSTCEAWSMGKNCTATSMNNPGATLEAVALGYGTESNFRIGSATDPLQITFTCNYSGLGSSTCVYSSTGTVTMNAEGLINAAPLTKTSGSAFTCPSSSVTLTVKNNILGPTYNYPSTATETVLCDPSFYGPGVCPNAKILPAGSKLLTGAVQSGQGFTLAAESGETWLNCKEGNVSFTSTQEAGAPLPASSYTNIVSGSCKYLGTETCSSASLNTPASTIQSTGAVGNGVVRIGSASEPLTLSYTCKVGGEATTCQFAAAGTVEMSISREPAVGSIKSAALNRTAGPSLFCGGNKVKLSVTTLVGGESSVIATV